ncbi:MAG TPA: DUF996 domain-containing protein [Verrucomicrobiae bacterium]|nr:DUF996 domain-containing protein [Verrucomicrobiae bacterium]
MTLESNKTLGGVGAILILVGSIVTTYTFGVLTLIGVILVFIALNGLANYYKERGIFTNAIYSLVAGIVGVVVAASAALYIVFDTTILKNLLLNIYPTWNGSWSTLSSLRGMTPNTSNISMSDVTSALGAIFLVLVILWVFAIVAAFFARRSLKTLSSKASVGLFSTAALLLIIGSVLTIIFIGAIIIWIAVLLIAIAFFQIKPQPEQPPATMAPPPSTPTPV